MKNKFLLSLILLISISSATRIAMAEQICVDSMGNPLGTCYDNGFSSPETNTGSTNNSDGLKYEMVSYGDGAKSANTPFFNLGIFGNKYFTINYASFSNGWQFIFDLIIGASIATAVVVFMLSAFQEIINGGNLGFKDGSSFGIKQGKEGMTNAIIGLMIILSTWLIVNTINPDLLRLPLFQGLDKLSENNNPNTTTSGQQNTTVTGF